MKRRHGFHAADGNVKTVLLPTTDGDSSLPTIGQSRRPLKSPTKISCEDLFQETVERLVRDRESDRAEGGFSAGWSKSRISRMRISSISGPRNRRRTIPPSPRAERESNRKSIYFADFDRRDAARDPGTADLGVSDAVLLSS